MGSPLWWRKNLVARAGGVPFIPQTQAAKSTPEAAEVKGAKDNDGDSDNGSAKTAQAVPVPTVNLMVRR